jgi:predicted nucleic acid-binding protein
LVALASAEALEILPRLYPRITAPPAVLEEVVFAAGNRPGYDLLERAPWLEQVEEPSSLPDEVLRDLPEMLGRGEREVLALADGEPGALLLLDDKRARRVARLLGLSVKGTAGLLVQAKRAGLLDAVRPLLLAMREHGYYLGDRVLERACREAGE